MQPEFHYCARKAFATGPWPKPDECHPLPQILLIYLRYILILSYQLASGLSGGLFLSKYLIDPNIFSSIPSVPRLIPSSFISLSASYCLASSILVNHDVTSLIFGSNILFVSLFSVTSFLSVRDTKFYTRTKSRDEIYS